MLHDNGVVVRFDTQPRLNNAADLTIFGSQSALFVLCIGAQAVALCAAAEEGSLRIKLCTARMQTMGK